MNCDEHSNREIALYQAVEMAKAVGGRSADYIVKDAEKFLEFLEPPDPKDRTKSRSSVTPIFKGGTDDD